MIMAGDAAKAGIVADRCDGSACSVQSILAGVTSGEISASDVAA